MPRKTTNRAANGNGSIRKVTKTKNGKQYTYWEGRVTVGYDPGTGKQKQRTVSGKTQKEVTQKMRELTAALDAGTYHEPCKLTVGEWLDIWAKDYLTAVKPRTQDSYKTTVDTHLKPAFGAMKLEALTTHDIQQFYNRLKDGDKKQSALSPKTIRNIHGVLHKALEQAVDLGYIRTNPASKCKLPKVEKKEIKPLDDEQIKAFLTACKGNLYEYVYIVTLFTGMREGEVLGLTWDCIDFGKGVVTIDKQLIRQRRSDGSHSLVSPKNGKSRYLMPPPYVMEILQLQKERQAQWRKAAGDAWEETGLVFTNELGHNLSSQTVYLYFKGIARQIGCPAARFHDLRHSYAVVSLQSGDDIKTVQENLGHHTAAFTLDTYAHVTQRMRQASASRMQQYINGLGV